MAKKTLNKANLEKLGAATLAALVMDLVQGNALLQRRARMELSAAQGPKDVAADIRKRFASLRRATSFVDWRKQRELVRDLRDTLARIETGIAPHDPAEAFELLWAFLQMAPAIHARTDDSNGAIGDVMADAVDLVETVAPRAALDPVTLAERILDAVAEAGFGEFDGIIPATAAALGETGLDHLKRITIVWTDADPTEQEIARHQIYGLSTSPVDRVRRNKELTRSVILADIADAQGDVDAYMARYSAEQLSYGTIAPGVARRLLEAGRVQEAHDIAACAMAAEADKPYRMVNEDLDEVYEDCLERLGRLDDLKAHLWTTFAATLSARCLRKYLKLLPDFDDMAAEEQALDLVEGFPHLEAAIAFLVSWAAFDRAARVTFARADALDGNDYHTLTKGAEALEEKHPLAAALLRRAMIEDTLDGAKSKRYRYAAKHLAECRTCDAAIDDYGDVPSHEAFVDNLKQHHGRKDGFWSLVDG